MCVLTHWEPKLVKITQLYLSNHLINIEVEKYGSSAFQRRVGRPQKLSWFHFIHG